MSQQVLDGIKKMDPKNDNHWTMDGLAKLDTVKFLAGVAVTREELEKIAPGFNREAMTTYLANLTVETGNATVPKPGSDGAGDGGSAIIESAVKVEGPADRKDEIETLAAQVARADETVLELQRVQEQARKDLDKAIADADALRDRLLVVNPMPTHQQNVRSYLDRVVALHQKRADARSALANSPIDLDALMAIAAPSPIDQALKGRSRTTRR